MTLDDSLLRSALGKFATGLTIITARDIKDGAYVGITANSFNSVSIEPPLILWSLAKNARSLPAYQACEYFAVNILAVDQVALSNRFATPQPDKFENIDFDTGIGDVPLLKNCAACFQCKTHCTYEGGDHLIFIGEVVKFDDFNRPGLVFHHGSYAVSQPHPGNNGNAG